MEVHHHSHLASGETHAADPGIHRGRKKWTHYFWEFLMLFLAVFCGFLAENQREHFVEAHRAKEYAKGLLSDMRLDTGELRRGIYVTNLTISAIDSIVANAKKSSNKNSVPSAVYYYSRFISYSFRIDWSRSTLDQLIQSGNLRYFRNKDLVSLINSYYYFQGLIAAQNQIDAGHRDKTMELRNGILINSYYVDYSKEGLDFTGLFAAGNPNDFFETRDLPLQKNADMQMDKYLNYLTDRKLRLSHIVTYYYREANKTALEIIRSLLAEYKLK
ncbi:MAG TPA: hypothetical protein VFP97_01165 [Chitinophagaceae bacterium]|nr:hypothetical protein [Chitinophagaceae bacterium]